MKAVQPICAIHMILTLDNVTVSYCAAQLVGTAGHRSLHVGHGIKGGGSAGV